MEAVDRGGWSPLLHAAFGGQKEVATLLLDRG
eukprot:CAMPEP_0201101316 /NCGR_PEP_ID=MMETSP0812-20130820/11421_1 /ASSEMBLY_ACC=CAM_ASM_000668 /TAXON_ID=98059 /ORGANISM="Dinobryon sp., Strain UTEXLB2267" /LENGTH=31 /DNA_ID= /DNA_START= /DNA_END= /DNA_ORIENTATION=